VRRLHVDVLGSGPRVVLVHGSVTNGAMTWGRQRPLARRFRLEIVTRPGFPPNPPVDRVDFELDAPLVAEQLGDGARCASGFAAATARTLEPMLRESFGSSFGAHLVGHSYGGIVSLLAAAAGPRRCGRSP
jgi:pimeloyl-ACP methyl ester carboxylesterase